MKHCHKCGETKPREEFNKCSSRKDGLQTRCRDCQKQHYYEHGRTKVLERLKFWKRNNSDKVRAHSKGHRDTHVEQEFVRRQRRRGNEVALVPAGWFAEQLERQGGVCWICSDSCQTYDRLSMDHCHESGRVRGLLCVVCNARLEKMEQGKEGFKDPEQLARARAYLLGAARQDDPTSPWSNAVVVLVVQNRHSLS